MSLMVEIRVSDDEIVGAATASEFARVLDLLDDAERSGKTPVVLALIALVYELLD